MQGTLWKFFDINTFCDNETFAVKEQKMESLVKRGETNAEN